MSPEIHAAIIAAVTSIIVTLPKFIYDCFQEKKRKNFQEKITDIIQNKEDQRAMMQVGANIVWSARVEWIQNVRNVTSEFITAVNDFVVSGDDTARKQNLELIRAKVIFSSYTLVLTNTLILILIYLIQPAMCQKMKISSNSLKTFVKMLLLTF